MPDGSIQGHSFFFWTFFVVILTPNHSNFFTTPRLLNSFIMATDSWPLNMSQVFSKFYIKGVWLFKHFSLALRLIFYSRLLTTQNFSCQIIFFYWWRLLLPKISPNSWLLTRIYMHVFEMGLLKFFFFYWQAFPFVLFFKNLKSYCWTLFVCFENFRFAFIFWSNLTLLAYLNCAFCGTSSRPSGKIANEMSKNCHFF